MSTMTLGIIKPGAVANGFAQRALMELAKDGLFTILSQRMVRFSAEYARSFYGPHFGKPYFNGLIEHTVSGPSIILVLAAPDAVARWRKFIGPTDPGKASPDTLRGLYASFFRVVMPDNGFHGSDSDESAASEIQMLMAVGLI